MTDVWLETHHKSALLAAQNQGVQVSLVIRPWKSYDRVPSEFLDRNILGDLGLQRALRRAQEPDWLSYVCIAEGSGVVGLPVLYDSIDPLHGDLGRRWSFLGALAHDPGLAGVVVMDTEPAGYEPTDSGGGGSYYAGWVAILGDFGYSEAMRLAFLRIHEMDPIVIDAPVMVCGIDISQPFFPNYAYIHYGRDNDEIQNIQLMLDSWGVFRTKQNEHAVEALFTKMPDLTSSLLAMPKSTAGNMPPESNSFVVPWLPGKAIPKLPPHDRSSQPSGGFFVFTFNEHSSPVVIKNLVWRLDSATGRTAIDVSTVKIALLQLFLNQLFPKCQIDEVLNLFGMACVAPRLCFSHGL